LGIIEGIFMSINERISEILKSNKNLTQKDLANSINVAASTVNNWLKLGRSIPTEYAIPISEFLGVDVYFLLTGDNISYNLSQEDKEWLALIHKLPVEAQYEFRGEIKGYLKRLNEEAEEDEAPMRQAK
jgi:transcriptional regulator with XRE-family HTH domain